MKKGLKILFTGFIIWSVFYLFLVFPDPFFSTEALPIRGLHTERVSLDLIDNLPGTICRGKWVRRDPFLGGCQISVGRYKGLVESKRAIPADGEINFKYKPGRNSIFLFSTGVQGTNALFQIYVNSKKVFEERLSAPPLRGWLYHYLLKYFHFRPEWEGGIWKSHNISLSPWKGKEIKITLKGKNGFWGNPHIIEPGPKRPNIIMIQVDALRADLVGKGILPSIDMLASGGAYFENAHSNGNWTRPSNVHQFFARFNREIGLSPKHFFLSELEKEIFYKRKFVSLPVILKKAGYRTAAIGDNIFLHGYSSLGIDFGFEDVVDMERERYQSPLIFEKATRWIKENRGGPFFLFLDFNQTHRPYRPPINKISLSLFLKNYHFALYQGCAAYTDEYIGKLIHWLEESGLGENTLIVLNADHGERFYTLGNLQPHGETLLEEEIRIPLIFYWKGRIKPHRFKTPVSIIDIAKTTLSLAGIQTPEQWRGNDLSSAILGGIEPPERPIILEGRRDLGIIYNGWKLILRQDRTIVKRLEGKKNVSLEKLKKLLFSLYPHEPEIFLVKFNVKKGSIEITPYYSIALSGGKGKIKIKEGKLWVQGKGNIYFLFKKGIKPEIKLSGARVNFTSMEIPWGENSFSLTREMIRKLEVPTAFFYTNRKGFTVATVPLLSFVYSPEFSRLRGPGALKSILIEWGYMMK